MRKFFLVYLAFIASHCFGREPKIYDCFLFFNELALLDIRLHELYDHVDKFVLVEATETFRGNPKPLYYESNKHLFKKFADKIVHIIVEDHMEASSPWDREAFHRDQIKRGLTDCHPEDIILIGDVDEIVRSSILSQIKQSLRDGEMLACMHNMFRFFLNRFCPKECPWAGTIAILFKNLRSPEECRRGSRYGYTPTIKIWNAGWHFTSLGNFDNYRYKIASYSHEEYDTPEGRKDETIKKDFNSLVVVPIDDTFPEYVQKNLDKAKKRQLIDPSTP